MAYLNELIASLWLLSDDLEWPDDAEARTTAETSIHAVTRSHVAETTLLYIPDDGSLLLLGEAWVGQTSNDELLEQHRGERERARVAADVHNESTNLTLDSVEQLLALAERDGIDGVPRILVDGADEHLVCTVVAAISEGRL